MLKAILDLDRLHQYSLAHSSYNLQRFFPWILKNCRDASLSIGWKYIFYSVSQTNHAISRYSNNYYIKVFSDKLKRKKKNIALQFIKPITKPTPFFKFLTKRCGLQFEFFG